MRKHRSEASRFARLTRLKAGRFAYDAYVMQANQYSFESPFFFFTGAGGTGSASSEG